MARVRKGPCRGLDREWKPNVRCCSQPGSRWAILSLMGPFGWHCVLPDLFRILGIVFDTLFVESDTWCHPNLIMQDFLAAFSSEEDELPEQHAQPALPLALPQARPTARPIARPTARLAARPTARPPATGKPCGRGRHGTRAERDAVCARLCVFATSFFLPATRAVATKCFEPAL